MFVIRKADNKHETAKSALHRRLKKLKVFKIVERGTTWAFWNSSFLQNMKNLERGPFGEIFGQCHIAQNVKRPFGFFLKIHTVAKYRNK